MNSERELEIMAKTIKELADELQVSKQTIQYHYQRIPTKNQQKDSHGKNIISLTAERIIRSKVAKSLSTKSRQRTDKKSTQGSKDNDWIIANLTREISEIKKERDHQFAVKDRQIEKLTKLLDQSQQLQLMTEQKITQIENNSNYNNIEEKKIKSNKKGFWRKIF